MTAKPSSLRAIIDLWPTVPEFARAIGIPDWRAYKMRERDSISLRHWDALIGAVKRQSAIELTHRDLHAIALASKARRSAPTERTEAA